MQFPSRIPKTPAINAGIVELVPEIINWVLKEEGRTIKRRKKDNACRFAKRKITIIKGKWAAFSIANSVEGATATIKTDAHRI